MTPIGRDEAAGEAARELGKPEYQQEPLIDELWRRLKQFLGDMMNPEVPGGSGLGVLSAVLIVAILAAVVALVVWRLRHTSRRAASGADVLFGERALNAADHRSNAERFASEGHWADAVRERLRAIARDLEERALVDGLPGRTADELAAEAGRALPEFAGELTQAARIFDDVTYGDVPGTPQAYGVIADLDDRLRRARPAPLAATPAHNGQQGGAS
ncbi:DUF4129 domain-containing protein [Nonomuraea sp. NPDC050663]|uniref:DUF4129 domain-containing protein n=1 Tax=Nonomuraea sp. NPDC050663 TaxID=3364370 RepID=UPI0037B4460E